MVFHNVRLCIGGAGLDKISFRSRNTSEYLSAIHFSVANIFGFTRQMILPNLCYRRVLKKKETLGLLDLI